MKKKISPILSILIVALTCIAAWGEECATEEKAPEVAKLAAPISPELDKLLDRGIKGLVVDVRDNLGGYYDEVVDIADRLLPEGTIVYTEDRDKKQKIELSDKTELGIPLAILVNGNSASASEVLAGAIKDHGKGVLVGTRTFGKGVVQELKFLEDGSGLKVTISRYFTPSGVCIQDIGIQPDIEVPVGEKYENTPVSQIPREEDLQLKKAIDVVEMKMK